MSNKKLDKIDKTILETLQGRGRITNVELAKKAGISAPPCLRRVNALEDAGFIKGYHADIDSASLGYGISVFANVKLASQTDKDLRAFEELVGQWSLVRECYLISGETDFLLRIVAKAWEDYQNFISNELTAAPNVDSVRSSMVMRSAKNLPGIPIE
jgi:DNA-binding Lrp family transcriptional regulator|tara:strand:- start:257019 stop:257489 length:471 start_codon:yes stop_codon:yes gene_type:complete